MSRYSLRHLSDSALLHDFQALDRRVRGDVALLVAHLGEIDARRLYAPQGYPSMYEYCVHRMHYSEQSAFKRIRVARMARQFPAIYDLLAEGKLHLSALVTLSAHLTPKNAGELLAASVHRTKAQLEQMLAERFPQPDVPAMIAPLAPTSYACQLAPGRVNFSLAEHAAGALASNFPSLATVTPHVAPLTPQRYAVQFTGDRATRDDLPYAQALLGHAVPNGDVAEVFARALKTLVARLEQQKFAKTDRPRSCRPSGHARQIPADMKRAVWERDAGRTTSTRRSARSGLA
jgi:hypothetical protein